GTRLHRDAVHRRLKGRRGARITALTSGGAIPDNANYDVVLEPDETHIGSVDEDFAVESLAGDGILLGNTSWRIRRGESGRVRVEDAGGAAPTIPFWLGEGPARTRELSAEVAELREEVTSRLETPETATRWLIEQCALDERGASLARDYIAAGYAALGAMPTNDTIVAERFFDEAARPQPRLHAPAAGAHQGGRGYGLAQAHLPELRLRAPGRRHRRRRPPLSGASAQLPPREHLPYGAPERSSAASRGRGVAGAHVRHPLALERHALPR